MILVANGLNDTAAFPPYLKPVLPFVWCLDHLAELFSPLIEAARYYLAHEMIVCIDHYYDYTECAVGNATM